MKSSNEQRRAAPSHCAVGKNTGWRVCLLLLLSAGACTSAEGEPLAPFAEDFVGAGASDAGSGLGDADAAIDGSLSTQPCPPSGCGPAHACGLLAQCDGACVDTQTSLAHCGGCGITCSPEQTCVAGACTCTGPEVSFADDVAPILERGCTSAGCHAGALPRAQLNLALDKSYDELVGVTTVQCKDGRFLVQPGHASRSYLMQKMRGIDMCSGALMPKGTSALPQVDLDIIAGWICRGAQR